MREFKVTVDGSTYQVKVEEINNEKAKSNITQSAHPITIRTNEEPKPLATKTNGIEITAPMPGNITKTLLSSGQDIKKNDVILVLEAMKMENDIISPTDGIITLQVSQGDNVEAGNILATISTD